MAIPAFDGRGLVPPYVGTDATTSDRSPYIVGMDQFAIRFATTGHRKTLIKNLIDYRRLIASGGFTSGIQFLDGSFVEDVETKQMRDPGDIDVFSLLEIPSSYVTNSAAWRSVGLPFWRDEVADRSKNKARFALDTYANIYPQPGVGEIKTIIYWYSLFGHQKTTGEWKGFAAVPLDPAADQLAMSHL